MVRDWLAKQKGDFQVLGKEIPGRGANFEAARWRSLCKSSASSSVTLNSELYLFAQ
jgi:hypothetical protein